MFPYELVKEGKIGFTVEQLKTALNDPVNLKIFFAFILVFVATVILIDSLRWLNRNRESIVNALSGAIGLTFMILIGYCIFISSTFVFLSSMQIDPKGLQPYYNSD